TNPTDRLRAAATALRPPRSGSVAQAPEPGGTAPRRVAGCPARPVPGRPSRPRPFPSAQLSVRSRQSATRPGQPTRSRHARPPHEELAGRELLHPDLPACARARTGRDPLTGLVEKP